MHKTRRRRNDLILRSLTYLFMSLMVIILALFCLFLVLGYTVNQKTGRAEQGGLIQFRSFPNGATVNLDGRVQGFTTPNETTTDATAHSVTLSEKGYRDWSKNLTLGRGEVLWLNALLVPSSITTSEVEQFDSVAQTLASPDKKWLAVLENSADPSLKLIDIRDEKNPKTTTLKIPETVARAQTPDDTFTVAEWDFGGRYLLVKHVSGASTEWLRLDRTDENNAVNLTTTFKLNFSELHFSGTSGSTFYGLSDGVLRKLNLGETAVPPAIASNVTDVELYGGNSLALVSQKNNQQIVSVYRDGDKNPTKVKTITGLQPVAQVALSQFFGDDYLAVSEGHSATLIDRPFDNKKTVAKISLPLDISWLYFSDNGQFLQAQTGALVDNYNLERNLNTQFTVPGNGPYTSPHHLAWLDDFHFWSDMSGTLRVFEFDGTNAQVISNVTPGQDVTLSTNNKRLFSIGTNTTTNQPVLQSSVMVVD